MNALAPDRLPITVLLAAKNEAKNLSRCLDAISNVTRIVVIDSNSEDETREISQSRGAEVVQFAYSGGYPKKRQWALENIEISTPWIILLDADEVVPDKLWIEIKKKISGPAPFDAYLIKKGFHFLGRRFKNGGFSHSAVILFRSGRARFERLLEDFSTGLDMEIHERVIVEGRIGRLLTPLVHEDAKGLHAYIDRHNEYSTWEARLRFQCLTQGRYGEETIVPRLFGNSQERRRFLKLMIMRVPFEHHLWFLYHYVFCMGWLEGRAGLIASQIRAAYIAQVRAKVYELKINSPPDQRLL